MEIYKKLQEARKIIKQTDIKKKGYNDFSNYYYFTPEQIDDLVTDACQKTNLIALFNMPRNELGLIGTVNLINVDKPDESILFTQSTDIPQIKATNIAQQLGGAVTYTKRYLLMNIFDITDNNLDFDTPQKKQTNNKKEPEKWLNVYTDKSKKKYTKEFLNAHDAIHNKGKTLQDIRKHYKVSKETAKILEVSPLTELK